MAQSDDGRDKDFVLNSNYRDGETLESREDVYYGSGATGTTKPFKHLYVATAGFLVLIVLSVFGITRTYSLAEKSQFLALQSRLEQLESRLGSMEGEGGLSSAGGTGNQLILLTDRLDQLEANMTSRINNLASRLETPAAKPAAEVVKKAEAATKADATKAKPAAARGA